MTDLTEARTAPVEGETVEQQEAVKPDEPRAMKIAKLIVALVLLYIFLVSIKTMGVSFKLFGKGFAKALISGTSNPFVGLFIGILATSIVQSSSTVTSMVVAFVASGTLTIQSATPVIMGANIGTTVTAYIVSMIHVTRKSEFERAYAAATVHDFFNLLTVATLLPLELLTGFLSQTAAIIAGALTGSTGDLSFHGPLSFIVKPAANMFKGWCMPLGKTAAPIVLLVFSVAGLIASLFFLTRVMKSLVMKKVEGFFNKTIGAAPILGILMGLVITATIQSSSVTTSLMVPMAAAGIMTLEQVFPVTLGANVGTTVTALLASLTGNVAGLTIALVHMLFNITGILIFYPLPQLRQIPLRMARWMGRLGRKSPYYGAAYVLGAFFLIPGLLIFIRRMI